MKLNKNVTSILVLASAGMVFGTGNQVVNAADDSQAASAEEADYPKLGAAQDAPTDPALDDAAPASTNKKTNNVQKAAKTPAVSRGSQQVSETQGAASSNTQTNSNSKTPVTNEKKTIKPKAQQQTKKPKAKQKEKAVRQKRKVVKKTNKKKNLIEVKSVVVGSLAVLIAGVSMIVYKKSKK